MRITLHQGAAPGFGTTGMMGHAELVRIFGNIQKYPRRGRPVLVLYDAYGVETKALNRAHARNRERFPQDFAFQLSEKEFVDLRCQFGTSRWGGRRYRRYAFTEQGLAMLSGVLNSRRAVRVNVAIMRTFVRLRQMLASNARLARKLEEMEEKYDSQFKIVFDAIRELMTPREPKKRRIGFLVGEGPARNGKARSKAVQ
ncbi:MAG: ORF6N domain-containing protein [Candidatus Binatia bacterium]